MRRLIDANALIEELENDIVRIAISLETEEYDFETEGLMRFDKDVNENMIMLIRDAPTIDAEPVRLGKWVKARGSWITPGGDPVWECSECGKGRHVYGVEHCSYGACVSDGQWVSCPNCGARMAVSNEN